jgi:16S rRNA C967 or C1407 C5-methylase (RsmB/RsmF family)/NOL1/NOP2/fmu family ribosome biogenesis protein
MWQLNRTLHHSQFAIHNSQLTINIPPPPFLEKMSRLLGSEYPAFAQSYEEPPQVGLRVNTLKISPVDFSSKSPFALKPVGDYEAAGFRVAPEAQPGRHPYHAAGLYYLQEPAAMAAAALLRPEPGDWVLDLAAAPGGKATHLASLMGDSGLLVANDVHTGRARILAENLERWGVRNALILNNEPAHLAAKFGPIFDKVLLDAPCSGEGMFRKQGAFEWSEGIVAACARRQSAILAEAARLVRPGGLLAYATCTFSPEEDEQVVAQFLAERSDFRLVDAPRYEGFADGRPEWANGATVVAGAVRLWPHRFAGEGHFIALLQREGEGERPFPTKNAARSTRPDGAARALWRAFAREQLVSEMDEERVGVVNGRYLELLPQHTLDTAGLHVIRHGLRLGELGKGQFKPAHALALALRAAAVKNALNFAPDDETLHAYLSGHPLPVQDSQPEGWRLICVDGYGLGWGKQIKQRVQNHYPAFLRRPG